LRAVAMPPWNSIDARCLILEDVLRARVLVPERG
jgi:hypothetical protein